MAAGDFDGLLASLDGPRLVEVAEQMDDLHDDAPTTGLDHAAAPTGVAEAG